VKNKFALFNIHEVENWYFSLAKQTEGFWKRAILDVDFTGLNV